MKLSRLNDLGVDRFADWLQNQKNGYASEPPIWLLADSGYAEVLSNKVEVEHQLFATRFDVGRHLFKLIEAAGLLSAEKDAGLWAWLTLMYIDTACPKGGKGPRKIGERARYIPEPHNFQRYYRHLLAGPFLVYRAHRDNPKRALCLLAQEVDKPGDIVEQLASRQEMLTNRAVVGAATSLYISSDGTRKRGAGGAGAGSPRRLADILAQFDLTWDLYTANVDELLGILPREFDRFKK